MQHCPDDSDYVSSYSRSQRLVELLHVEVVMLTNMVGKGEIDEDLADETKDEAGKYGEIKSVNCVEVRRTATENMACMGDTQMYKDTFSRVALEVV